MRTCKKRVLALALAAAVTITGLFTDLMWVDADATVAEETLAESDAVSEEEAEIELATEDSEEIETEESQEETAEVVTETGDVQVADDALTTDETEEQTTEAQAEEDSEETEEDQEEVNYPAISFDQTMDDGTSIHVEAPEGAFPEGTTMVASVVAAEEIVDAVAAVSDETVAAENLLAYDISFYNNENQEIEPECDINVTMTNASFEADSVDVYHMDDVDAEAEVVGQDLGEVVSCEDGSVEISSDEFSIYVFSWWGSKIADFNINVNVYPGSITKGTTDFRTQKLNVSGKLGTCTMKLLLSRGGGSACRANNEALEELWVYDEKGNSLPIGRYIYFVANGDEETNIYKNLTTGGNAPVVQTADGQKRLYPLSGFEVSEENRVKMYNKGEITLKTSDLYPLVVEFGYGTKAQPLTINGQQVTYDDLEICVVLNGNYTDITLDANGGTFSDGSTKTAESRVFSVTYKGPSETPTKEGYIFDGWYTEQTGGTEVDTTTMASQNKAATFYAHWKIPKIFVKDGDKTIAIDDGRDEQGAKVYSLGSDNLIALGASSIAQVPVTFTIGREVSGDGICKWIKTDNPDITTIYSATPTLEGYETSWNSYVGYYYNDPGTTDKHDFYRITTWYVGKDSSGNYTIFMLRPASQYCWKYNEVSDNVKWAYSKIVKKVNVSFNANGGTITGDSSYTFKDGTTYGALPTPTWDGHVFDGWYTTQTGGTQIIESTTVDLSITALYAHWHVDASNATITVNDTCTYNGKAQKPSITVTLNDGKTVVSAENYTATYSNNINAGTAKVAVKFKGIYVGDDVSAEFTINKAEAKLTTSIAVNSYLYYDGSAQKFIKTAGVADGGTIYYKLDRTDSGYNKILEAGSYTTNADEITGKNAGYYVLHYYVKPDSNHTYTNDTEEKAVWYPSSLYIQKGDPQFAITDADGKKLPDKYVDIKYYGNKVANLKVSRLGDGKVTVSSNSDDVKVTYTESTGELVLTPDTYNTNGNATVKVSLAEGTNYFYGSDINLGVTVYKGTITVNSIDVSVDGAGEDGTITYDGAQHKIVVSTNIMAGDTKTKATPTITYAKATSADMTEAELKELTYSNSQQEMVKPGTYYQAYKISSTGYYDYYGVATVTINKKELTADWSTGTFTYDTEAHSVTATPNGIVGDEQVTFNMAADSEGSETDAGSYTAKIDADKPLTGKDADNYTFNTANAAYSWTIAAREQQDLTVTGIPETCDYTGSAITFSNIKVQATVGTKTVELKENQDYSVAYANNTNAGQATVTFTLTGNYTGTVEKCFTISKVDSNVEAPKAATLTYNGADQTLLEKAATTADGTVMYSLTKNGSNWTTDLPVGKNAAEYTVYYKVVGDGNHNDSDVKSVKVTIAQKPVTVTWSATKSFVFDYEKHSISASVNDVCTGDTVNVIYDNNTVAAPTQTQVDKSYKTKITGLDNSNYVLASNAQISENWSITAKDLSTAASLGAISDKTYTGSAFTVEGELVVKDGDYTLTNGTDYTLSYKDNTDAGKATVTATFKGNYSGSKSTTFTINKADGLLAVEKSQGTIVNNLLQLIYGTDTGIYDVVTNYSNGKVTPSLSEGGEDMISVFVIGNKVTLKPKTKDGQVTVTLTSAGGNNYKDASTSIAVNIVKGQLTVAAVDETKTYNGHNQTVNVTAEEATDGNQPTIQYALVSVNGVNYDGKYSTSQPAMKYAGTYEVAYKVSQAGYQDVTGKVELTIEKKPVTVSWSETKSFVYDYQEHSISASVNDVCTGDTVNVIYDNNTMAAPTQTQVDKNYKTTITGLDNSNYVLASNAQTSENWSITAKDLSEEASFGDISDKTYTGDEFTVENELVVKDGEHTLTNGTDYELSYGDNTDAGTATVTATFMGNYSGSKYTTFTINKADGQLEVEKTEGTILDDLLQLIYGTDTAIYQVSTNVSGGKLSYELSTEEMADEENVKDVEEMISVSIDEDKITLIPKTEDGQVTVTLTADGGKNYNDASCTIQASIVKGKLIVEAVDETKTYNSQNQTVNVTAEEATDGSQPTIQYALVTEDAEGQEVIGEYSEEQPEMKNVGKYTVAYLVSQAGYDDEEGTVTLEITAKDISQSSVISSISEKTYTGSAFTVEDELVIKDGDYTLVNGTDYTLVYANNTEVGTATVTVNFMGNYSGSRVLSFVINSVPVTEDVTAYAGQTSTVASTATTSQNTTTRNRRRTTANQDAAEEADDTVANDAAEDAVENGEAAQDASEDTIAIEGEQVPEAAEQENETATNGMSTSTMIWLIVLILIVLATVSTITYKNLKKKNN